jgi:hypothetical protein
MPRTAPESTPASKMEFASSHISEFDPDCLNGDLLGTTQVTWASQPKHRTGRRRLVDPTTCERDYSPAELEFMQDMQKDKGSSRVIQVVLALYLLPALLVVLAIGGLGMLIVGFAQLLTGPARASRG